MKAIFIDKSKLCLDTWEFIFHLEERLEFLPGQYIIMTVPRLDKVDERGPRRQFSITNSYFEFNTLRIATRVRGSGFKHTLMNLNKDEAVEISKPYGNMILPEDTSKELVMIAGGIGITPFMSMLYWMRDDMTSYAHTVLFYSNKNRESMAFFDELKELQELIPHCHVIPTMTDDPTWNFEQGRIDESTINKYVPHIKDSLYYIAGPELMNESMESLVESLGVPKENITREDFTGY